METIAIYIAAAPRASSRGRELIAFVSLCPICGHQRLQSAYTCDALIRLLKVGRDIDATCITCDALWSINDCERADIVRTLVG